MSTINATIRGTMTARLNTLTPAMVVAWENVNLDLKAGTPWLRATLLPADPEPSCIGIDGWTQRLGIFQVDVFYPLGAGWKTAVDKVDDVCDLFTQGQVLRNEAGIRIVVVGSGPGPGLPEENWFRIPINIRYACWSNI